MFAVHVSAELRTRLKEKLRAKFEERFATYYGAADANAMAAEALALAKRFEAEFCLCLHDAGQRLLSALDGDGWALWPFLDIDNLLWDDGSCEWTVRAACRKADIATAWATIINAWLWRRKLPR